MILYMKYLKFPNSENKTPNYPPSLNKLVHLKSPKQEISKIQPNQNKPPNLLILTLFSRPHLINTKPLPLEISLHTLQHMPI